MKAPRDLPFILKGGAVFIIGMALRLLRLGKQPLFLDEAWSWAVTLLPPARILQLSSYDPHPPLYYLLLKGSLSVLPPTEAGLRALSALCSIVTLAVLLVFVARWWDARAAVYAGWFAALSSFDLYYAQEARMYTFLGFMWLLAYILLIEALQGRHRLLIGWGLVNVIMVWTHSYGLLAVAVHLAFALSLWGWHRLRHRPSPLPGSWLGVGAALTVIGTLPLLFLLWSYQGNGAGGAWIPHPEDILVLSALWTVGLTAARAHFLDGTHLALPFLSTLPLWIWALVGFLLSGSFAAWGISRGWKSGDTRRWAALLALLLTFVPVTIAFGYAAAFDVRAWAYKPFLGAAYLFYLWGGVGLSRIQHSLLRRGVAAAVLVVSLASLIPYYTTWQKTDAAPAFHSLPPLNEQEMVLLDRAYASPVAFYYLGPDAEVWGIAPDEKGNFTLTRIFFDNPPLGDFHPMDCNAPAITRIVNVWAYGPPARIREERENWPPCLTEKRLWVFEKNEWIPLDR